MKKLTDEEIIKAVECCINDDCDNCPDTFGNCEHNAMRNAFDLIKRKDAEIERLNIEIKNKERAYNDEFCSRKEWQSKCQELIKEKQIIRSKVMKELERFKETVTNAINAYYNLNYTGYYIAGFLMEDIDNFVKEIMEELE